MLANSKPFKPKAVKLIGRLALDEDNNEVFVYMRPLDYETIAKAKAEATSYISKLYNKDPWLVASEDGAELVAAETQVQIIAEAMLDKEDIHSQKFASVDDIRQEFLPSEISYLFEQWAEHQNGADVFVSVSDIAKEVDALVEHWGKGRRSRVSSRRYVTDIAHSIITALVDRVSRQQETISSLTSQEKESGGITSDSSKG